MTAIIPGSGSIAESVRTVEFIKMVATNEGLEKTLQGLADQKKEIEQAHNELMKNAESLEAQRAEVNKMRVDATRLTDASRLDEQRALTAKREAEERLAKAEAAEAELNQRTAAFQAEVHDANGKLTTREEACAAREKESHELLEAAKATKIEYEQKLADLRKLAT